MAVACDHNEQPRLRRTPSEPGVRPSRHRLVPNHLSRVNIVVGHPEPVRAQRRRERLTVLGVIQDEVRQRGRDGWRQALETTTRDSPRKLARGIQRQKLDAALSRDVKETLVRGRVPTPSVPPIARDEQPLESPLAP